MTEYLVLRAILKLKILDLLQLVEKIEYLYHKHNLSKDDDYIDGIALHLQSFYTTTEKMLEGIATTFTEKLPVNANSLQNLLMQMSVPIPSIRPAVISQETRQKLDEYRGFRHAVRNVYTLNLRPSRVRELVGTLRDCYESLADDLEKFCDFMETMVSNG